MSPLCPANTRRTPAPRTRCSTDRRGNDRWTVLGSRKDLYDQKTGQFSGYIYTEASDIENTRLVFTDPTNTTGARPRGGRRQRGGSGRAAGREKSGGQAAGGQGLLWARAAQGLGVAQRGHGCGADPGDLACRAPLPCFPATEIGDAVKDNQVTLDVDSPNPTVNRVSEGLPACPAAWLPGVLQCSSCLLLPCWAA